MSRFIATVNSIPSTAPRYIPRSLTTEQADAVLHATMPSPRFLLGEAPPPSTIPPTVCASNVDVAARHSSSSSLVPSHPSSPVFMEIPSPLVTIHASPTVMVSPMPFAAS
ncbi:UNVERIFIED_CONTAM: hypothetical protein Sradi_3207100 [Sesamum radiatum]|uniref:Uncharacterized protein n=1 Tax=Sesamum radiatum TaxID=300843 RepID=A0AAW2RHQ6_SESRA